jgi:KDO2-lipid IV(A) lauroyltransferase
MAQTNEKVPQKKDAQNLDEIPEGGLNDIMKILRPVLEKYTRFRLYNLFKLIPRWIRYAFWSWVGERVWGLRATRKIVDNGIKSLEIMFPEKSPKEILQISKNAWRVLSYGFFSELLVELPTWNEKNVDKHVKFIGLEHLENALKRGKGVIIASTHVGLLPAMYIALALKGYKTNIIANVRVSGPLVAIRPIKGIRGIPTGSLDKLKPKLEYVLKNNELLYIFADFSQKKQMGIKFMGRLGHTPAGIPPLAKETGAAIIPTFTYPISLGKYAIRFLPEYKLVDFEDKKEFLGYNMLQLNNMMTWLIKKIPHLYFEYISYDMLKLYRREIKVTDADSRKVAQSLLDLARQVVYTTYEKNRKDQRYYEIFDKIQKDLEAIPNSEISDKRFSATFEVGPTRVRDSIINIMRKAIDLHLDISVQRILQKGLQEIVIL